jgi:cytochrome c oxidase cbb3-type subunit 2
LVKTDLDYSDIQARMRALRVTGVPYSLSEAEFKNNVKEFGEDVAKSLHIPDAEKNLVEQAEMGNFDTHPEKLSEMDALVSYLQMLGTLVDFKKYDDDYFVQYR